MSVKQCSLASLVACLALTGLWTAHAQDEEEGPYANQIQYRQSLMKSIGGHVGATAALLSGRIQQEGHLKVHAAAIAGVSDDLAKYFPKDSTDEDSAAKPEIWQNWTDFEKKLHDQRDAAIAYAKVVQADAGPEEVRASFKKLTDTCKACHEDYRRKD